MPPDMVAGRRGQFDLRRRASLVGILNEPRHVLANMCASAFRLGHGPHLLPKPSLPGKDTWEEVPKGGRPHHASRHRHPERAVFPDGLDESAHDPPNLAPG